MAREMTEEQRFTVFVIELYKQAGGLTGQQVYELFRTHGLLQAIEENYFLWHIEAPDNFIAEIDRMLPS
jgi:hypothetical protein